MRTIAFVVIAIIVASAAMAEIDPEVVPATPGGWNEDSQGCADIDTIESANAELIAAQPGCNAPVVYRSSGVSSGRARRIAESTVAPVREKVEELEATRAYFHKEHDGYYDELERAGFKTDGQNEQKYAQLTDLDAETDARISADDETRQMVWQLAIGVGIVVLIILIVIAVIVIL